MLGRLKYKRIIGILILIGLAIFAPDFFIETFGGNEYEKGKYAELIQENVLYSVTDVLDGDTIVANVAGHNVAVRLIGMDTPEIVDPRKPVQCFGPEASAKAKELLYGKEIYLEKEKSKGEYDKYGRILAYALFNASTTYNEYMIREGYAKEYTFNKEKYRYQKEFKEAQALARAEKKGMWGSCEN